MERNQVKCDQATVCESMERILAVRAIAFDKDALAAFVAAKVEGCDRKQVKYSLVLDWADQFAKP